MRISSSSISSAVVMIRALAEYPRWVTIILVNSLGQIDVGRLERRRHDAAGAAGTGVAQIELARCSRLGKDVAGARIERQRIGEGRERQLVSPLSRAIGEGRDDVAFLIHADAAQLADLGAVLLHEGDVVFAGELAEAVGARGGQRRSDRGSSPK